MTATGFITLLAGLLGFLSQLNWIASHGPDSIWYLRLTLGGLAGWGLAKGGLWAFARITGRNIWPGFAGFRQALAQPKVLYSLCFLFFAAIYLLSMGGHFYSYDDRFRFETTKAMVERGELLVSLPPGSPQVYSKYGIVQPVLSIPLYLLGKNFIGTGEGFEHFDQVMVSTFMQITTALLMLVIFLILRELKYSKRASLGAVVTIAFSTMFWPYAKFYFTEPFNTLCLMFAFWQLLRFKSTGSNQNILASGVALGIGGVNATMLFATAVPILGLYAIWILWPRPEGVCTNWKQSLIKLLWFGVPMVIGLAFLLGFNEFRYGSPFKTGYEGDRGFKTIIQDGKPGFSIPWFVGLYGLLLSAGKSVFLYNPPLVMALACLGRFTRRAKAEAWVIIGIGLVWLAFYCKWWAWHGDICWGPRYLLPALGFAFLPLAEAWEGWRQRSWGFKALFAILIGAGLAVQFLAISAPFAAYFQATEGPRQSRWHLLHYVPHFSPLWGQAKVVAKGMNVDFYLQKSGLSLWLAWLAGLLGLLLWMGSAKRTSKGQGKTG